MNSFKVFIALGLFTTTSLVSAMSTMPQFENQQPARRQQRGSLLRYFVPSSKTVKGGLACAALYTGAAVAARMLKWQIPSLWEEPLPYKLLSYAHKFHAGGNYIIDENRHNVRCYALQKPKRYQQLSDYFYPTDSLGLPLEPLPDAPERGWSPVRASMALATEAGSDLLLSKFVPMAVGSCGILQKAGALMALGAIKPGLWGVATLFGVNLAAVFGAIAAKYAVERLIVNPIIRPVLVRVVNSIKRSWEQQSVPQRV